MSPQISNILYGSQQSPILVTYTALMIQLSIFLSVFGLLLYSAAGYTTNNNYHVEPPVNEPPFVDAAAGSLASL